MTAPSSEYDEILEELIQLIRDDDTANSETIDGLVRRLQELNALATAQFFSRMISTGNGLTGGGDLSEDRTISLSEGAVDSLSKADSAVQPAALNTALSSYLKKTEADAKYATVDAARQVYAIPFTHAGTVNGQTTSPQVRLPRASVLTDLTASVDAAGSEVTVTVTGGASASVTIPAGQTSAVAEGVNAEVSGPVRVRIESSSAEGTTVMLRVREV